MKAWRLAVLLALASAACKAQARHAVLKTSKGEIRIRLDEGAPATARAFVALAERGFYDGLIFHRVIPGLLVQTGDPTGKGQGGSGASIPDELGGKFDAPGAVGMARWGPNTASSQFFITLKPMPDIDGLNARFATVVEGLDVARAIAEVPRDETDGSDRPLAPPKLERVFVK